MDKRTQEDVTPETEAEELFENLIVEFDEMSFFPATLCPDPEEYVREWKQKLINVIGQLRKETAEKFAERLKTKSLCVPLKDDFIIIQKKDIDKTAKEITS